MNDDVNIHQENICIQANVKYRKRVNKKLPWWEMPFIEVKLLNDFPNHDIDPHYSHPISQI